MWISHIEHLRHFIRQWQFLVYTKRLWEPDHPYLNSYQIFLFLITWHGEYNKIPIHYLKIYCWIQFVTSFHLILTKLQNRIPEVQRVFSIFLPRNQVGIMLITLQRGIFNYLENFPCTENFNYYVNFIFQWI